MKRFELGYTPNNLVDIMENARISQQDLADELEVSDDSVNRWRRSATMKSHVDMPLSQWRKAVNYCEADYDIGIYHLENIILDALKEENLVYSESMMDSPQLIVSYHGRGNWRATVIRERAQLDERHPSFIFDVGIEMGLISYDGTGRDEGTHEEIEIAASARLIDSYYGHWARVAMAQLGPWSYDGRKMT